MRLRKRLIASGLTGSRVRAAAGSAATSPMSSHVSKLAAVNTCFWIMKIAATTLGETGGDLVSMTLNLGYAVSVGLFFGLFLIFLVAQLVSKAYHPLIFWTVILLTATMGTAVSDFIDRTLGLGYVVRTLMLIALLLGVLGLWYLSERSLAVDQIRIHKAEVFYWVAILVSNTLGTALGDFLADSSGLGFVGANLLITGALGLVLLATFLPGFRASRCFGLPLS